METLIEQPVHFSTQKAKSISITALLIALLAIGLAPIFVKLSLTEIGAKATVFNRFWIAAIVFGIWNRLTASYQDTSKHDDLSKEPEAKYTLKTLSLLLLVGGLFAAIQLLWVWSLTRTSVASSVTILHGLRPFLTTFGGWILFKKRYDGKFLIGMTIAVIGSILIGFHDFSDSIDKLQGDLSSALSAIFSSLELLIMEQLLTQFKTETLLFWCCIIGSLVTLIVITATNKSFFPISWQGWVAVIALALFSQVIGQGLITYSLNHLSSGFIAVAMLLDPVTSALLAWFMLSEQITLSSGLFCCIVLAGIYISLSSKYAIKAEVADVITPEPLLD